MRKRNRRRKCDPSEAFLDSYIFADELNRKAAETEDFPLRGLLFLVDHYDDGRENPILLSSYISREDAEWLSDIMAGIIVDNPDIGTFLGMSMAKALTQLSEELWEDQEEEEEDDEEDDEED